MKFLSTMRNRLRTNLLKNNRGQGATEYILLLVVVVALVVMFKDAIKTRMKTATDSLGTKMDDVTKD
jgi:Flp pilus assembly pilin Flp